VSTRKAEIGLANAGGGKKPPAGAAGVAEPNQALPSLRVGQQRYPDADKEQAEQHAQPRR
jgi:hypothetical protein